MCYIALSVDQAVNACPMCKVFPHPRCPHTRDVCRNRASHPRFDVLYLKNAEVDSFNGCGYCKWARTNPPAKTAGYNNTGWPGCCRAPTAGEHRLIQPADWRSVSIVHHVPIPPEVKSTLESLGSPVPPSASPVRAGLSKPSIPPSDRRNSSSSVSKTAAMAIPGKSRAGSSPPTVASSITSTSSRGSGGSGGGASTSVPSTSSMDQAKPGQGSSNSSPSRKHIDLDVLTPRRNSSARPPVSSTSPSVSKTVADLSAMSLQPERRRSLSSAQASSSAKTSPSAPTSSLAPAKATPPARPVEVPRPPKKVEAEMSSASSSSGSDSLGSLTESTITSDGGFTDYLSDESEAELQRQAEAKAALVAQNEAEEQEFRAARQALAHIGLRPPKSWTSSGVEAEKRIAPSATSARS